MDDFKIPILPSAAQKVEKKTAENAETTNASTITKSSTSAASEENSNKIPNWSAQPSDKNLPEKTAICSYKIPSWSAPPSDKNVNYKFEVLKSGQIISIIDNLQKQANWMFGRLAENDIVLAHPTISRYHCCLQYRPRLENYDETSNEETNDSPPEGWYIYDLGSTHGTFLNKQRIPAKVFIRIRVGHMLKLGASTRSYILQGPLEDEEPESEFSITELREQREHKLQEAAESREKAVETVEVREENEGISWGMSEDANEETDLMHNPYASSNNEDYFAANPKQALRHYFEREDMHLEYKCDEMSLGSFVCRIDLPVDDENGRPITAEVVHKGKKKDCVFQCALEACRILDRLGVLRQKNQEPLSRRKKAESDSDEDEFLDRTGDIARKKERKANANTSVTLTYDDLLKQEKDLVSELEKIESSIAEYQAKQKRLKQQAEAQNEDDLDSFMEHLNEDVSQLDKTEIKKLRLEQQRLNSEQQRLKRLIKIAKPYELPFPKTTSADKDNSKELTASTAKKQLPMIGKRNQFSKFKVIKPANSAPIATSKTYASDEEEMDEDDKEETKTDTIEESQQHLKETSKLENIDAKLLKNVPKEVRKLEEDKIVTNDEELAPTSVTKTTTLESSIEEPTSSATLPTITDDMSSNEETSRKRARQRPRIRSKRQAIDVEDLDEHESSEKYAKWVPPANQSGDGFTALNEKFGY